MFFPYSFFCASSNFINILLFRFKCKRCARARLKQTCVVYELPVNFAFVSDSSIVHRNDCWFEIKMDWPDSVEEIYSIGLRSFVRPLGEPALRR